MSDEPKRKVYLVVECEATGEPGDFVTLTNMACETLRSAIMADCDDADEQGRYLTKYTTGTVAIGAPLVIANEPQLWMTEDGEGGVIIGFRGSPFL